MVSRFIKLYFTLTLCFVSLLVLHAPVLASTTDGTVSGYAWSDKIGWINFGTTNGNVHVTDSAITGYAWNENTGRILLNPTQSGVANDAEGTLSGRAWNEGTGWINFSGVTINSSGVFEGTATGDNDVDIYFSCDNCNVTTDWRPESARTGVSCGDGTCNGSETCSSCSADCGSCSEDIGGGGGGGAVYGPPKPPFSILINNNNQYTNNKTVSLLLNGGPDADRMAVSNSSDFLGVSQESYLQTKTWTLAGGDGTKTVYAKFYTKHGVASDLVLAKITLDTIAPEIKITSIKEKYATDEEVVLSGTTEPNAEVFVLIDDNYGMFSANEKGEWYITFGTLPEGLHRLELTARDLAQNIGKTTIHNFTVEKNTTQTLDKKSNFSLVPPLEPILRKLEQGLSPIIPKFFQPAQKPQPQPIVIIPKTAQTAFLAKWRLLPEKPIARFVLAPLPQDVKLLAQQFPQIGKTFSEVGVAKATDVQKIQNSNLKLPGLTETVGLAPTNVTAGKLSLIKGVPVAQLSATAKSKIPSNVIFSKAGGGLVDFNVALSVNGKGQTEQRIKTLVSSPLQLVVKPDAPVKRVHGYIVFKSRTPSDQTSFNVPMDSLSSSFVFAGPNILMPAALSAVVSLEGTKSKEAEPEVGPLPVETRLVLAEFDYIDSGSGVYTATVQSPMVDGEYEIITVFDYTDTNTSSKEIKLITVVDPEGYIYEKNGEAQTRIAGAVASLYWLNPDTKQYELWPAKDFQQENPQITDVRGSYSFLVPDGYYYLKVEAPGYLSYDGKPFQVAEGSGIHINVELKTSFWFLNIVDWKNSLLIVVILLLLYNFYKDRRREKQLAGVKN